jgi:molybdopterin molybdotransferase
MAGMRTVADHQAVVRSLITVRPPTDMALADSAGLVLAADVMAPGALPPFDNSAMDGYAVRAVDIGSASERHPVFLPVDQDIPAGLIDVAPLRAGTAHRIMTGAPMPSGADTVVQVEATDGGTQTVAIRQTRASGVHVRNRGEDVAAGERVLVAGTVLGPAQLGLLAALGQPTVAVIAPPRVLVLSTGSELVEPGEPLRHGQIHESNGVMLAAAIRAAGALAEQFHFVADDVEEFNAALADRLPHVDLVVTSGGVSAGAYEVVKDALTGHGVEFVKVAMQPGMPQGAGVVRGVPFVTLPGNPVSALVSFEVFLRPALRAALGHSQVLRPMKTLTLSEALDSPAGKRQFRRGVIDYDLGSVRPIGPPGSHFLRWLAACDCLLDLAEDVTELPVGASVEAWLID